MAFEEQVKASFAAAAIRTAEDINTARRVNYLDACRTWGENYGRPDNGTPKPVCPKAVKAVYAFEPFFYNEYPETGDLVSNRKPEDFIPVVYTHDNISVRIGAPMTHDSTKYSQAVGTYKTPADREIETVGEYRYQYIQGFFGLSGYWVKL